MKELMIHIGTHKTGSTSFQRMVLENAKLMKKKDNILYLKFDEFPLREFMVLTKYNHNWVKKLREYLTTATNETGRFLVSREYLSGDRATLYSNHDVIHKMLRDATKDLKVRIMVVLRRQDEFIQSLYTQVIHRGEKIEHSINEFLGTFDWEQLKWTHFLKPLQQYFGPENVDIYPYDPYVFQKYTIVELLNHSVGSSVLAALSNVKTDNIGYSSNGIEIANRLNDALNVEQRQILRACLQKTSNKGLYHEYNLLEPSLKKELISFYSEDNHELFQKYFQSRFGMVNYSDPNFDSSTRPIADDYDDLIVTLLHEIEKNKYSNNLFLDFLRRLKKKIVK